MMSRPLAVTAVAVALSARSAALVFAAPAIVPAAAMQQIASPDAHLQATITIADDVRYALTLDGAPLVLPSPVSLSLADGRVFGRDTRIVRVDRREISEEIPTPIGKRASVKNACRELAVLLSDGATLRARVFDDGFALRWETALPGRVRVRDEGFAITFLEEPKMFFLGGEGAHHGYEGLWRHEAISTLGWSTQTASLPLVVDLPHGPKLGVLQADLDDYPAMYLASRPSQPRTLSALFPRRVVKEQPGGYMNFLLTVTERADDIAETAGTRAFPWRAFVLARRDADLVASDMVTRLAPPPTPGSDFSWVKPGKVVWDYWADWNLEGVDFVAGRNTRTFKFYVDFAAEHGLPYVNIDWLWSDPLDLMSLNPEIDVPEIVRYARERNVGVFVWCLTRALER